MKRLVLEILYKAATVASLFAILVIFAVACTVVSEGQTVPVYCQADTIKAMRYIWTESRNGTSGIEASFMLNGAPEAYSIEQEPMTGEKGMQTIIMYPGSTFAIVHVHPNNSGQYPSTPVNNYTNNGQGDTGMADKRHIDVYVVHRNGLSVYLWRTKETVLLRQGMSWQTEKGCF